MRAFVAYPTLCRTMTGLGEANAPQFPARLAMLAIAWLNAAARDLIEAAAAALGSAGM